LKPAWANGSQNSISKIPITKKRSDGIAQVVEDYETGGNHLGNVLYLASQYIQQKPEEFI
jgi:hypothetical protein